MSMERDQFIEFGGLLTRSQRVNLVEYIERKMKGETLDVKKYEDISQYIPFIDSVAALLPPESNVRYKALFGQVSTETLKLIQEFSPHSV